MIRINLLPFRVAKKKEDIRRQVSIYLLSVVLLLAIMGYFYFSLNSRLNRLENEKVQKTAELKEYAGVTKKIAEIKKNLEEVRNRLKTIKTLEQKKSGPVFLLDEIAQAVPNDRLWLNSIQEKEGLLTISGTAKDNETVALFMTNLEKARYILFVDLENTRLKAVDKYKVDLMDFTLKCKSYAYEEPAPEAKEPDRRPHPRR